MRLNYAIVFVSDVKRSVSFYRDVLGLPLRFESPGWTEFATDGATLVLHPGEGSISVGDTPQQLPPGQYADPDGLVISVGEERRGKP